MDDATARLGVKLAAAGVDERSAVGVMRGSDLPADATDDEVDAAVEAWREAAPGMFGAAVVDGREPRRPASSGDRPRSAVAAAAAMRRGAELAERRHPSVPGEDGVLPVARER